MNKYKLLPYIEIDGIRTFRDSEIMNLFSKTEKDGLIPVVFYEGTVQTPLDFLRMAKAQGTLFYVLTIGECHVGYVWLNRPENRTIRLHFCVLREFWCESVSLGKYVLDKLSNMKTKTGEYIFDLFVGWIPEWNTRASRFANACGWKSFGPVPNAIFNIKNGKSEPAFFYYYTRGL